MVFFDVIVAYTVIEPALMELKNAKNRSSARTMARGLCHTPTIAGDEKQPRPPMSREVDPRMLVRPAGFEPAAFSSRE